MRFLRGNIKIRGHSLPKSLVAGILGVVFLYVSVAGIVSVTTPWWVRGDTVQHVDYAWRLHHGHIPKWSDGITYPPFVKLTGHFKAEAASANPPLCYLIHAPIIGPLLDRGHWQAAIALGRTVNIFIGILCIFALAWAGWIFGQSRRALFAVTIPAVSVLMYRFTRLNVDFALDALVVLWATLTLIFDYKILQNGLQRKYILALATLSVLGMATKATYVVFLALSLLAILIAARLHGTKDRRKDIWRGGLIASGVLALVVLSTGWFYWRNHRVLGNFFSASPPGYTGGRVPQTLSDVLHNKKLWQELYLDFASSATISLVVISFAVAGWFSVKKNNIKNYIADRARAGALVLLGLTFIGMFVVQIKFAIGVGSINFRYMLPAVLPISLFLVYGLLSFAWTRGQLVWLFAFGMGATSILLAGGNKIHGIYQEAANNSVPAFIPTILLILFFAGGSLLAWSLYALSGRNVSSRR